MLQTYLTPGEYFFGDQAVCVTTVLGSCVAMTMFHRQTGLAAACHAVQPDCGQAAACKLRCPQPGRYINCVVPAMIRAFEKHNICHAEIDVKLFGGAAMIGESNNHRRQASVGHLNISAVKQIVQSSGLKLKAEAVGGHVGRKIIFNTTTGIVHVKRMQKVLADQFVFKSCGR